ncbi:MAG: calycin-like domain-containing protein [Muribaculaceae bacterium]|nr:calycin-like domain-containing protein [Muribaculaceae bacterium]
MKKYILTAALCVASLSIFADTEVLKISLVNGEETTIPIADIKEMSFTTEEEEEAEPTMAEKFAGVYNGTQTLTVAGMYKYSAEVAYTLTAAEDGTLTVSIPQYSLTNTMMGDLTLGALTISGLEWNEEKVGFYRMYANDGLTQHFLAVKDGSNVFDNDYALGGESNILITLTDNKLHVENPFKLGAMPLPMTATFEGEK